MKKKIEKKSFWKSTWVWVVGIVVVICVAIGLAMFLNNNSKKITLGEWEGNVYSNEFFGFKFTLPEGWSRSSDEEIKELLNEGLSETASTEGYTVDEIMEYSGAVYYLMAVGPDESENIQVMSEKVDKDYTEEDYEEDDDEEDDVPVAHIDGKHLEFNNIPIDGTLDEFCSQLDGFELVSGEGDDRIYSGRYAGRSATLYVSANPETGMVYRVIVELQKWCMDGIVGVSDMLRKDYTKVLESFKKKYGEEYADEQYDFDDESAGDADYEQMFMQEVADGDSCVATTFKLESDDSQWYSNVMIYVEFDHDDDDEEDPDSWYGCVNISYVDGENEPFPEDEEE